jgi:hypothetical protein
MEKRGFLMATLGIGALSPAIPAAVPEEKPTARGVAKGASLFRTGPYL